MKIGDKVRVINHLYKFIGGYDEERDCRELDWPIGSVGTIVTTDGWNEVGDGKGISIVDEEGEKQWGFHVDEVELISPEISHPSNYIEFIEEDGIKFSLPRGSFFVSELPDGKARINTISRVNMWNVQETYEEVMKKVEE